MKTNTINKSNTHFQFIFGIIMLALSAMGGASSCSNSTDNQEVIDTLADSPVQKKVYNMINVLGLTVTQNSSNGKIKDACIEKVIIKAGDIVEFGYHDEFTNEDLKLKLNQDVSAKDTLVFEGTSKNLNSGEISNIRYTMTQSKDGMTVKKEISDYGKNSGVTYNYEYITTNDGVLEYKIKSDGTESYQAKYTPNTETSITKTDKNGNSNDFTNIALLAN